MSSHVIAGAVLLAGAAITFAGILTPFAARVYGFYGGAHKLEERIAFVEAHPAKWRVHSGLFAIGAAITPAGLVALAQDGPTLVVAALGLVGGAFGAAFVVQRLITPPAVWFRGTAGTRPYWAYTTLTIAAFAGLGLVLLEARPLLAAFLLGWNALLVGVAVYWRDLPPFTHYVGAAVAGVALVASG